MLFTAWLDQGRIFLLIMHALIGFCKNKLKICYLFFHGYQKFMDLNFREEHKIRKNNLRHLAPLIRLHYYLNIEIKKFS